MARLDPSAGPSSGFTTQPLAGSHGSPLHPEEQTGSSAQPVEPNLSWFCIQSKPRQESVAAATLRHEVEVYLPRVQFRRVRSHRVVLCTEALFPNYLFARLDLTRHLRFVRHAQGVRGIVQFGADRPIVPAGLIDRLRSVAPPDGVLFLEPELAAGQAVRVCGGQFHGLEGIIARLLPSRHRVTVLMDLLGGIVTVELPVQRVLVVGAGNERAGLNLDGQPAQAPANNPRHAP